MDENDVYDTGEPDTVRENLERYGVLDYKPMYERCARTVRTGEYDYERCTEPAKYWTFIKTNDFIVSHDITVPDYLYVGLCATHAEEQGIDNE